MSASKGTPSVQRKQIRSKVDTGLSRNSSSTTLTDSRPYRAASRDSGRLSVPKATTRPRPNTSFTSAHNVGLPLNDRVQQGVHPLGHRPAFLNNKRPPTATGRRSAKPGGKGKQQEGKNADSEAITQVLAFHDIRYQKFQNNLREQYGQYATSKALLEVPKLSPSDAKQQNSIREPNVSSTVPRTSMLEREVAKVCAETDQIELGRPPCEGHSAGDARLQEVTAVPGNAQRDEKMEQLLKKFDQLEVEYRLKEERVAALEAELREKTENNVEHIKLSSKLKEALSQINELKKTELELNTKAEEKDTRIFELIEKDSEVQTELAKLKSSIGKKEKKFLELSKKYAEEQKTLEEIRSTAERKDKRISELLKRDAERSKEMEELRKTVQNKDKRISELTKNDVERERELDALQQKIEALKQEIVTIKEDATTTEQTVKGSLLSELAAKREEVANLRKEHEKLRFDYDMLASGKRQDDVLLDIRAKLLEGIQSSKEAFKVQCEEIASYEQFAAGEKQLVSSEEEEVIAQLQQNMCRSKSVRDALLKMVKRYKKENRQMRQIMIECGPNLLLKSSMKEGEMDRICGLFPDEPMVEATEEFDLDADGHEEIISRTVYNEEIFSNAGVV